MYIRDSLYTFNFPWNEKQDYHWLLLSATVHRRHLSVWGVLLSSRLAQCRLWLWRSRTHSFQKALSHGQWASVVARHAPRQCPWRAWCTGSFVSFTNLLEQGWCFSSSRLHDQSPRIVYSCTEPPQLRADHVTRALLRTPVHRNTQAPSGRPTAGVVTA